MRVTLNQLQAFERVMRLGSFRRASRELGLTQPSVSQRIQELESALDTPLFVRAGPRATPTGEAHALLVHADRMLGIGSEIEDRFKSRDPMRGMVRIGMSENFALVGLGDLLQQLERSHPSIKASLFIGDSGLLSQQLNRRELDVAIVAEPAIESHVERVPVGVSRVQWFAAAHLDLPREALDAHKLAQYHLMTSPPTSRQYATVMRWFHDAGALPGRLSTCNNVAVTRLAILEGVVLGLVPVRVMSADLAAGAVKVVAVRPPIRPHSVSICYQTSEWGPALRGFVELTRQIIAELRIFEPESEPVPWPAAPKTLRSAPDAAGNSA